MKMYPNNSIELLYTNNDNINNLLGQTVKNTIILQGQPKNSIQNPNLECTKIPEYYPMPYHNAYYCYISPQKRPYGNKFHKNYVHPSYYKKPQNVNKGLSNNLRKLNSIIKNGKIIYNIDVNIDTQGLNQRRHGNYHHHINNYKNLYKYKNNSLLNKKNVYHNQILNANKSEITKMNQNILIKDKIENKYKQTHSNPNYHLSNKLSQQQPNKNIQSNNKELKEKEKEKEKDKNNNNINPGIIEGKITETIYQIQDNNIEESNKNNKNSIIPKETIKSTYQIKESNTKGKNPYPNIIPQETVKSLYQNTESNNKKSNIKNPYPNIIPQETIKSLYQNTESNNKVIKSKNDNLLSKISPTETIQSIYKNKKDNIELNKETRQKLFSKDMPNETIVSIYEDQHQKLEDDDNPLLRFMPNETIKSVYQIQE